MLGRGLYSVPEAARLLGVTVGTLRRWVDGYTFRSRRDDHFSKPVVRRDMARSGSGDILTFRDLIELKFVSMFRKEGVSLPMVRAAAKEAERLFQTDHPFAIKRFKTDGKHIFATLEKVGIRRITGERLLQELARGQMVIEDAAKPFFHRLEFEGDEILRWRPLGPKTRVVLDPHRSFGKPIDEESGIPTLSLYRMVRGGETQERVAWWYGVDVEAVSQAVQYESSLRPAA